MSNLTDVQPIAAMLIGDQWLTEASGGTFEHVNAATGRSQETIPLAGDEEINRAVAAARAALPGWRAWPPDERRNVLYRLGSLIREHADELATLTTLENGTPTSFATFVSGTHAPENFFYYAGWTEKIEGCVIPVYPGRALNYTVHEPYGVVGVIVPWNGPLGSLGMKVAPALATGNTVVIKPPELAPFTSVRFAELCLKAGLPPGVVNVTPGGPEAGSALVRHPGVDKITFTGGSHTARHVLAAAAENLTPVVLELGGKSANILYEDANVDVAVPWAVMLGIATLSGQGCMLPTRLLVHGTIYTEVVDAVGTLVEHLSVGNPFEAGTVMGPVVSSFHCDRIMDIIERAKDRRSGRLIAGGERLGGALTDGFYIAPTVFADVDPMSELAQQEIFGPVLSIFPFASEEEAIALANNTRYGLAGYLWTDDLQRAHRVAAQLEVGTVGINGVPMAPPNAPFGGYKASGYGREGGRAGLEEFLRIKNVHLPMG